MMTEPLIPFQQIPKVYKRLTGVPKVPSHSSVRRWYRNGVRGGVSLRVRFISGQVFTTTSALKEFIALRDAQSRKRVRTQKRLPTSATRSPLAAMARLEAMGV